MLTGGLRNTQSVLQLLLAADGVASALGLHHAQHPARAVCACASARRVRPADRLSNCRCHLQLVALTLF